MSTILLIIILILIFGGGGDTTHTGARPRPRRRPWHRCDRACRVVAYGPLGHRARRAAIRPCLLATPEGGEAAHEFRLRTETERNQLGRLVELRSVLGVVVIVVIAPWFVGR